VLQKGLREVSAESTGLQGEKVKEEEDRVKGARRRRGGMRVKERRYSKVKVITEPDTLQSITQDM